MPVSTDVHHAVVNLVYQLCQGFPLGFIRADIIVVPGSLPPHVHNARLFQNLEMVGNRGPCQVGFFSNLTDPDTGQVALQQHQQDELSGLIADGGKGIPAGLKALRNLSDPLFTCFFP